MAAETSTV